MKKFLLSIFCLFSMFSYATAEEVTVKFSEKGYANAEEVVSVDLDENITVTFDKGTNSNTPKYYNTGAALRIYGGGYMTITANNGATINNVSFTINVDSKKATNGSVNAASTVSAGTLTIGDASTATTITDINANEVTFTQGGTSGHVRIVTLTVNYSASAEAPAVEAPAFSVEKGTYYNPFNVEITAEEGATVYYTTDGTEPTAESTEYTEAIAINEFGTTTTIKAIAVVEGEWSNVASATYSLEVSAPDFSVKGGVYTKLTGMNALKFTVETNGATILYNNRGGSPKTEGSKTYGSLSVLATATIKAVAFVKSAEGDTIFSDVVEEKYYISEVKPFEKATEFVAGDYVIYASNIVATPIAETSKYDYLPIDSTEIKNDRFVETFAHYVFTFAEVEGGYTIQDTFGRYLYMSGTYNSFNVAQEMPAEGAVWTVAIDETTGEATITNVAKNKYIQLSTKYKSFGSYATEQSNAVLPTLFAAGEYPTMVVTPENWATVPCFDKVTVTCEQGISYNETEELYAYYTIGWDYTPLEFDNVTVIDEKTIEFSFNTPIENNGDYRITFPAGVFTLYPNGLATASEETQVSITVDNPNILEVTYANPDNGATVNKLDYLYFEFSQDIFDNVKDAVITAEDGTEYPLEVTYTDSWGDATPYNALCLKTAEPITTPGEYTFVLKKEYIYAGENVRIAEDVTYYFTVIEGLKVASVTPAEDAEYESVSEIVLTFNKPVFHDYVSALWVYDEAGNEFEFTKQVGEEEYQVETLKFVTETPITAAGTYTFTLEDYAVYCYGSNYQMETAGTLKFTFTVKAADETGINNVESENGKVNAIFDLTGRKVKEITAPGIYIVNGKKIIVK